MTDEATCAKEREGLMRQRPLAVTGATAERIRALCELHLQAFPRHMQCADPHQYFAEALADERNINIVMPGRGCDIVGYLLGIPQAQVYEELRQWDPLMQNDTQRLYLDIIQVAPEHRGKNVALRLFQAICLEAEKRNIYKLSMHARTITGLNAYLHRIFSEIRFLRRVDNWYGSGEPFDYLEASTAMRPIGMIGGAAGAIAKGEKD